MQILLGRFNETRLQITVNFRRGLGEKKFPPKSPPFEGGDLRGVDEKRPGAYMGMDLNWES
jgi:hypothetical protein